MARKKVVSLRLTEEEAQYLYRTARRLGRTPSATAAMLVDEGLRRERFPMVEIRETAAGRVAYLRGRRVPVWMIVEWVRAGDAVDRIAEELQIPVADLRGSLDYAAAFPTEVETLLQEAADFDAHPEKHIPGILIIRPDDAPSPR